MDFREEIKIISANLSVDGLTTTKDLKVSNLTDTRVPFIGAGGVVTESPKLSYLLGSNYLGSATAVNFSLMVGSLERFRLDGFGCFSVGGQKLGVLSADHDSGLFITNSTSSATTSHLLITRANEAKTATGTLGHILNTNDNWRIWAGGNKAVWVNSGLTGDLLRLGVGKAPTVALDINGSANIDGLLKTDTLKVTTGAVAGHTLISDATGNAVWTLPAGGSELGFVSVKETFTYVVAAGINLGKVLTHTLDDHATTPVDNQVTTYTYDGTSGLTTQWDIVNSTKQDKRYTPTYDGVITTQINSIAITNI